MNDRRRVFLDALSEHELKSRHGWCDLTQVGALVGLDEQESENLALALKRQGLVEFQSEQGNHIRTTAAAGRGSTAAIFDQRGQQVTYQYNAAGDINIGAVQDRADLARELSKLGGEVEKAAAAGSIDKEVATDAKYQVDKAAQQAEKPAPDKDVIVKHLTTASDLVKEVGAAAGLATGLLQAIDKVRVLF